MTRPDLITRPGVRMPSTGVLFRLRCYRTVIWTNFNVHIRDVSILLINNIKISSEKEAIGCRDWPIFDTFPRSYWLRRQHFTPQRAFWLVERCQLSHLQLSSGALSRLNHREFNNWSELSYHCTLLYCTAMYFTIQYFTGLNCTVLYCTVLYFTVLYCTVLYSLFIVLYCTTCSMSSSGSSLIWLGNKYDIYQ